MFKVNDLIMYGITGVCKVTDIEKVKFKNEEKEYYVLSPIYAKNTTIKIPVDNKKVSMRRVSTKENVDSIISNISNQDVFWIDDYKERAEKFKDMVKGGECEDLVTVVRSIYSNKKKKKSVGKKIYKTDDEIMKVAQKLLNEEFGTALHINPSEVPSYIKKHMA